MHTSGGASPVRRGTEEESSRRKEGGKGRWWWKPARGCTQRERSYWMEPSILLEVVLLDPETLENGTVEIIVCTSLIYPDLKRLS
jgi:hypothetical protein